MNKNLKKVSLIPIFILLSVFSVYLISAVATVTLVSPAASSNSSSTVSLRCDTTMNLTLNATFYYGAGTAATTLLTTVANTSTDQVSFTTTASITSLTDAANYNFTCAVGNSSKESWLISAGNKGITLDSTSPTCTATTRTSKAKFLSTNTLTCTCTDGVDSNPIESMKLYKPSGNVNVTSTSYTASGTDLNQKGTYTYSCSATDYTGNGKNSNTTFQVVSNDDSITSEVITEKGTAIITNNMQFILIGAAIVGIVILFIIIFSHSQKKR